MSPSCSESCRARTPPDRPGELVPTARISAAWTFRFAAGRKSDRFVRWPCSHRPSGGLLWPSRRFGRSPGRTDVPTIDPASRPSHFSWNAGGWFGSQVGCTAWLLTGAVFLAPLAPRNAACWLACFVIANGIGTWLWSSRGWIRPYLAIQLLLLVCGICGLVAFSSLDMTRPDVVRTVGERRQGYLALLILPALMAWFAVLEHGSRSQTPKPGAG